jgi:hypothetical protein
MRFALRDLMWLTVVLAVSLGWLADRVTLASANANLRDRNYRVERDNSSLTTYNKKLHEKNSDLRKQLADALNATSHSNP